MKIIVPISIAALSLGEASKVALQRKSLNGSGLFVNIGTPETKFFLGADFSLTTTRIYTDNMRAIFFGPLPVSESRVRTEGGGTADIMGAGEQTFGLIPMELVGRPATTGRERLQDQKMGSDSEGRLALGPDGTLAKNRIVKLCFDVIRSTTEKLKKGLSIDFVTALPRLPTSAEDIVLPRVVDRNDGWFIGAKVKLNGRNGTTKIVNVAMDPTVEGIEVPMAAMRRLAVIMRMTSSGATVDEEGRLMLPCTSAGAYEVVPDMVLELGDGRTMRLIHPTVGSDIVVVSGRSMCPSLIRIDTDTSTPLLSADGSMRIEGGNFRINPMIIDKIHSVFYDGRENTITFRIDAVQRMNIVSISPSPKVAMFNSFSMLSVSSGTNGNAMLLIPDVNDHPGVSKYMLHSSKAVTHPDGSLCFTFAKVSSDKAREPPITNLPGLYELVTDTLSFDMERRALTLELKPVTVEGNAISKKGPKRYIVSIERDDILMLLMLRPANGPKGFQVSDTSSHLDKLQSIFRGLGNNDPI
jgi:hypothetical protein